MKGWSLVHYSDGRCEMREVELQEPTHRTPLTEALRHARINRMIFVGDLAKRLNLTPVEMSNIERGVTPIPEGLLPSWLRALNLPEEYGE